MERIIENRAYFMGMAILLIMASHLLAVCKELTFFWIFYPGFIGVDIFLFLSGYGLCRSWENNGSGTFYRRRLQRILPMFLCFQIFVSAYQYFCDGELTVWDAACNISTLSFWHLGGLTAEWYLSFLLYLYLLFPLFYKAARVMGVLLPLALLGVLLGLQYAMEWPWNYDAAFSRIPIFAMGIVCYLSERPRRHYRMLCGGFTLSMLAFAVMVIGHRAEKYEVVYMAAPCFMLAVSALSRRVLQSRNIIHRTLNAAGRVSLELYVANMMVLSLLPLWQVTPALRVLLYIVLQLLLSGLLIVINKRDSLVAPPR